MWNFFDCLFSCLSVFYGFWFVLRQVSMCSPTAPELNSVDWAVLRDVLASTLSARFKGVHHQQLVFVFFLTFFSLSASGCVRVPQKSTSGGQELLADFRHQTQTIRFGCM